MDVAWLILNCTGWARQDESDTVELQERSTLSIPSASPGNANSKLNFEQLLGKPHTDVLVSEIRVGIRQGSGILKTDLGTRCADHASMSPSQPCRKTLEKTL